MQNFAEAVLLALPIPCVRMISVVSPCSEKELKWKIKSLPFFEETRSSAILALKNSKRSWALRFHFWYPQRWLKHWSVVFANYLD